MCPYCQSDKENIVKIGFYRGTRSKKVQRYHCKSCRKTYSDQTLDPTYRLRRTYIRNRLFRLLSSGVSQRRAAHELGVDKDTVARYLEHMGRIAGMKNAARNARRDPNVVVFDEMETFEHSKCKPVSIFLAVEEETRFILEIEASQMPAKGKLARISRKKYGRRMDHRPASIRRCLTRIGKFSSLKKLKSDKSPRYPGYVRTYLPGVRHETFLGRRGCVVGQGELKEGGWDPLFALNHTAAMIRYNLKRLARRTWCTTKSIARLQMCLNLVAYYCNQLLRGVKKPRLI